MVLDDQRWGIAGRMAFDRGAGGRLYARSRRDSRRFGAMSTIINIILSVMLVLLIVGLIRFGDRFDK